MIISRDRRFIFVHIPKTGGTAFTLAYEERAGRDDILIGDTPKARNRVRRWKGVPTAGRLWKHAALTDVIGLVSEAEIEAFLTMTLVRNPWDRMVSYYHWLREQRFAAPGVDLAKTADFHGFLNHPSTLAAFRRWPCAAYMRRPDGTDCPSVFVRLEHFAEDIAPVEAHLGFRLALPVANESRRDRDWRPYYSAPDAELVERTCADDIARYGYRFDSRP
jgi:Sulfotransferase family